MKRKLLISLICLLTGTILGFYRPSQAERNAQAQPIAVSAFTDQTMDAPTPTHLSTAPSTLTPMPTNTSTPPPTSTPGPSLTATLSPMPSAPDIFARVSPSVAFIQTPTGTGSGVLIDDGFVLTNAHVVWPFQEVRVVFPDGSEYLNTPVMNWDMLRDIAIVGPLKTSIRSVSLVDGEDIVVGGNVYLIGYPGEVEQFPQPTLTRGVISRLREWEPLEITYFQTDATITGGQSGGALISESGELIGISGLSFSHGEFGLVASASDLLPLVQGLIDGEDVDGLGDRHVPLEAGRFQHTITLRYLRGAKVYVINEPVGTVVDIKLEGENKAGFVILDVFGNPVIWTDETPSGAESGSVTIEVAAPYFLVVFQIAEGPGDLHVSSNCRLAPHIDGDDGARVTKDQTVWASLDYPGDIDYFWIRLVAGDTIHVTVSSMLIDPFLTIGFSGAMEEERISDDDSGGGLFGLDPELTYRAPHSGIYFIIVENAMFRTIGGYLLTVTPGRSEESLQTSTLQLTATPADVLPMLVSTPDIPMALYTSAEYPFAIQYPAGWAEQSEQEEQHAIPFAEESVAVFVDEEGSAALFINEEDLVAAGVGELTLEECVDLVLDMLAALMQDFEIVSRHRVVNAQGMPVQIITYTVGAESAFTISQLFYMHEDEIVFYATYIAPRLRYQELESLIRYSFSTFQVTE